MVDTTSQHGPLGQAVVYPDAYDPSLLFPIDRARNRASLHRPGSWHGYDVWNAYEISWLNPKGRPIAATARFIIPEDSPFLIESKSFKLYLNSFNEGRYDTVEAVAALMHQDLSRAAGAPVEVHIETDLSSPRTPFTPLNGRCLDELDITVDCYEPNASVLRQAPGASPVTETVFSHLLKSNCPVTGQPDWGTVQIHYSGPRIDPESLLRYIVSFRRHTEFHEHCVERMYCDLWHALHPESLTVAAFYTRRGGLDINPVRSSHPIDIPTIRTVRQ